MKIYQDPPFGGISLKNARQRGRTEGMRSSQSAVAPPAARQKGIARSVCLPPFFRAAFAPSGFFPRRSGSQKRISVRYQMNKRARTPLYQSPCQKLHAPFIRCRKSPSKMAVPNASKAFIHSFRSGCFLFGSTGASWQRRQRSRHSTSRIILFSSFFQETEQPFLFIRL